MHFFGHTDGALGRGGSGRAFEKFNFHYIFHHFVREHIQIKTASSFV